MADELTAKLVLLGDGSSAEKTLDDVMSRMTGAAEKAFAMAAAFGVSSYALVNLGKEAIALNVNIDETTKRIAILLQSFNQFPAGAGGMTAAMNERVSALSAAR